MSICIAFSTDTFIKVKNMKKYLLLCLTVLILSGCASLHIPETGTYPFQASFKGTVSVNGEDIDFRGVLSLVSSDRGFAQIYGPMGIALYTADLSEGVVKIYDVWGREVRHYPFEHKEFLGLLAGVPPDLTYLWKKTMNDSTRLTYLWGNILLDQDFLPREVHVKSDPVINAFFEQKEGIITLMMNRGSDKLSLDMDVVHGGRWSRKTIMHDNGGS
jgi:hypothetical protein